MEINKQSSLSSLSSSSNISEKPLEKVWIGHKKRLDRHTLGRVDAAAQVGLFAILTAVSTVKLLGRVAVLVGKTICHINTSKTVKNLAIDALVTASCFEKIIRSAWRVFSAPKLKDLSFVDSGKKAIRTIMQINYNNNSADRYFKTAAQIKLKEVRAAYISSTGSESDSEPDQKIPKRKLNLSRLS